jgi:hypothetical protein
MATSRVKTSSILQGFPKSRSLLAGNDYYQPTSYESIATQTVGATAVSSITFSSIPSTYTHLQIRIISRLSGTGGARSNTIRFNSDTGTNYRSHFLVGNGSSVSSFDGGATTRLFNEVGANADNAANIFGSVIVDILDYRNTNKYKVTRTLGGLDTNGGVELGFVSGLWLNTSAISTIDIIPETGNYTQYSSFALYGIKGA